MDLEQRLKEIEVILTNVKKIYSLLELSKVGDIIEYEKITVLFKETKMNGKIRTYLTKARDRLVNEKGILFATINSVGLKRMDDSEIVNSSGKYIKRISRMAKKSVKKLSCSDYNILNNEDRIKHNTIMSLYGGITAATSIKSFKKVEAIVKDNNKSLPLGETLELFK